MTYLVTGATGFIGTKLVDALLGRGDAVFYLARRRSMRLPSQASFHPWDTARIPELDALPRIDAMVHLAGEPVAQRWSEAAKERIYASRVEGTKNLVAALAKVRHRPAVLVSASAIGYYGDRGDEILTEGAGPGNDFLAKVCSEWEQAAMGAREYGVRTVAVRIATVLGREGGALPKMMRPFRWGLGGRLGDGKQWMSWIQADDLVRLFLFAADTADLEGAVNGASPEAVTNAEFTKRLARALERPAIFRVPRVALKLAFGEMAEVLLASARVVPQRAQEAGFRFEYPDLTSALRSVL